MMNLNDMEGWDTSHPLFQNAYRFLMKEALCLDSRDFASWLAMLHPEIRYRVPVTITTSQGDSVGVSAQAYHYNEDFWSLQARVARFGTQFAWAEDPPSRTRRFVTNVMVGGGETADQLVAVSYFLLFRSRGDATAPDLLSGCRRDVLQLGDAGELRLRERTAHFDEVVLRTQNLALFV